MPNRIAEAILSREMNREGKQGLKGNSARALRLIEQFDHLPFLAIESDGGPFPQIITAKIETFLLQARRVHEMMRDGKAKKKGTSPPSKSGDSPLRHSGTLTATSRHHQAGSGRAAGRHGVDSERETSSK
jgi:hypothetical protein